MKWRVLVVAVVALTAGCGSFAGGSAGPTPTVTPAPVPEPTATPAPQSPTSAGTLAPGLTGAGIVDVEALAAAHRESLRGYPYVRTVERHVGNETVRSILRVADARTYRHHAVASSMAFNTSVYADGETVYTRVDRRDLIYPRYGRDDEVQPAVDRFSGSVTGRLARHFPAGNVTVAETSFYGTIHYEVIARGAAPEARQSIENYTARAVIAPTGLVRSLTISYVVVDEQGDRTPVTHRIVYVFQPVTVERPSWVADTWPEDVAGNASGSTATGEPL